MGFFETIYSWFHSFYNQYLWDALRVIINDEDVTLFADSLYIIGIVSVIVSFLVAFAFYVWPINHPRFYGWKAWLVMFVLAGALNFGIGFGMAYSRVQTVNENEEACELVLGDEDDNEPDLSLYINSNDYLGFGLSNLFVGLIFFVCSSIPLMFYDGAARFSPFRL